MTNLLNILQYLDFASGFQEWLRECFSSSRSRGYPVSSEVLNIISRPTRNEIRCGCDALSLETKRLRNDHNEVPHCPMCREWNTSLEGNNTGIPLHHPYTECQITQGELMILLDNIRLKNGDRYAPGFPKDTFKELLTPSNWDSRSNKLINNWCKTINQY